MFKHTFKEQDSIDKLLIVTGEQLGGLKKQRTKTEEELQKDVEMLKEWWKKQAHLPQDVPNDETLTNHVVFNKYSLEKTKLKIEYYFSVPHMLPEFFTDRDPSGSRIQYVFKTVWVAPMPKLTADFGRVYVVRPQGQDFDYMDQEGGMTRMLMMFDLVLACDNFSKAHLIVDMRKAKMSHQLKANPITTKKFVGAVQRAYPIPVGSIHIVNKPSFFNMNLAKTTLSEKMFSRLTVHEDEKELLNCFAKEILPIEYGGEERTLEELNGDWAKVMESNRDFFDVAKRQSNESLRVGEPPKNDLLGVEGSFRQLTLD